MLKCRTSFQRHTYSSKINPIEYRGEENWKANQGTQIRNSKENAYITSR